MMQYARQVVKLVAVVCLLQSTIVLGCKRLRSHNISDRGSSRNSPPDRITTADSETSQERDALPQQDPLGSTQDIDAKDKMLSATVNHLPTTNGSTQEDVAERPLAPHQQLRQHRKRQRRCNLPGCSDGASTATTARSTIARQHTNTDINDPLNHPGAGRSTAEVNTGDINGTVEGSTEGNVTNFPIHFICHDAKQINSSSTPQQVNRFSTAQHTNNSSTNLADWARQFGECDKDTILQRTSGTLNDMGLCPWTYEEHYDANREPQSLMFARCECPHCVIDGTFSHTRGYRCTPVVMKMKVKRIQIHLGEPWYHEYFEEVPVACVCSRPRDV